MTVTDGDSPHAFKVRLTNEDPEANLSASFTDFSLVDSNDTVHEISDEAYTTDGVFPTTVTLGPGESAEGWLFFDQVGPGPWELKFDSISITARHQLPFDAGGSS